MPSASGPLAQPHQSLRPGSVTVGIATWNRRHLLQQALESVLTQTFSDIEIVVSDDASTDDTWDFLQQIYDQRLVIIRKPSNSGIAANYQTCLEAATCEFFLLLNDDDVLLPTAIEKLRHAFLHPAPGVPSSSVGMAWCPFTNVDTSGAALWNVRGAPSIETSVQLILGLFRGTRGPICSAVMMRTADCRAVGGYEQRFEGLSESATFGKAALLREFAVCVNEPLMRYLVHHKSSTTENADGSRWQDIIRLEVTDFAAIVRERGDPRGARLLTRSGNHVLANITASIMMRWVGRPGWIRDCAREFWRCRSFMLSPFVLKRFLHDGWKLIRLRQAYADLEHDHHPLPSLAEEQL